MQLSDELHQTIKIMHGILHMQGYSILYSSGIQPGVREDILGGT